MKKFDEKLFKKYDKKGKETVRKFFESEGFLVAYNPNDYLADMILLQETEDGLFEKIALLEVGVRPSWVGKWPTNWDLRIEKRKDKYLKQGLPVCFCVVNKDHSHMVVLVNDLKQYPIKKNSNRLITNEESYIIPSTDLEFVDL